MYLRRLSLLVSTLLTSPISPTLCPQGEWFRHGGGISRNFPNMQNYLPITCSSSNSRLVLQ